MADKAKIYDIFQMRAGASDVVASEAASEVVDQQEVAEASDSSTASTSASKRSSAKRPSVKKSRKRVARPESRKLGKKKEESDKQDSSSDQANDVADVQEENAAPLQRPSSRPTRRRRSDGSFEKIEPRDESRSSFEEKQSKGGSRKQGRRSSASDRSSKRSSGRQSSKPARRSERPKDLADQVIYAWQFIVDKIQAFIEKPHSRSFYVMTAGVVCVLLAAVLLYPSVKNYYVAVRETAKSQVEYKALQEYYDRIKDEVSVAKSDKGVEDLARSELGYTKEGDNAINVLNIESDGAFDPTDVGIVPEGSIKAPDTWYSGFLDPFFGYDG